MKVALLLYGQPRFLDRPEVLDAYNRFIFNSYQTDVFAQCWFDSAGNYGNPSSWASNHGAKHHIPDNAPQQIMDLYNPVSLLVEKPQRFIPDQLNIGVFEKRFSGNEFFSLDNISNTVSQIKALDNVCQMAYNATNHYDAYVLGRYDAVLDNFPDLMTLKSGKFYMPMNGHFNDLVNIFSHHFLNDNHNPFYSLWWRILHDRLLNEKVELPIPEMYKYEHFKESYGLEYIERYPMYAHVIRN